tara:strand:- start:1513 stop:1800 length:288 start_codon:yes stop_codon:yes gene_type:complete
MKKTIFSTQLLKEIYLSNTCFLFIDEERVTMASPVATGIINAYDMNFWDKVKNHEVDLTEALKHLTEHLITTGHTYDLIEHEGIFVLTFQEKASS